MYDGQYWIADFKQMHGLYPGREYRRHKPAYMIYRYPGVDAAGSVVEHAAVTAGKA